MKQRLWWVLLLLAMLLTGPVTAYGEARDAASDAKKQELGIEALAQELLAKHGIAERGDYGWLDSTDFDLVDEVDYAYEKFLKKHGVAAAALVGNAPELRLMAHRTHAALLEVDVLLREVAVAQQGMDITRQTYRAAEVGAVAALRTRVEQMPMQAYIKLGALQKIEAMELALERVHRELSALGAELNALNLSGIRFDATADAHFLLERYGACSADARTRMGCRERAVALSERLAFLKGTAKEYEALLASIPQAAKHGAAVPYAFKAWLAELAARYDALEPYVRGRLDAELGGARPLFLAARKRIEERTQAVQAAAGALEALPDAKNILLLDAAATAACRERVLAAQERYRALAEDAERGELSGLVAKLEQALLATEQFTVTLRKTPHGTATVQGRVYYGKECVMQVEPETGWTAKQLFGADEARRTEEGWRFRVLRDMTVAVEFERLRYSVMLAASCTEEGCLLFGTAGVAETVEHGGAAMCAVEPEASHRVAFVTATLGGKAAEITEETLPDGTGRYSVKAVDGPAALVVRFEPRMLVVTTQCLLNGAPAECGGISEGKTVRWGGAYEGEATAKPGYLLVQMLADGGPVPVGEDGCFIVYDIRTDTTVSAVFEKLAVDGGHGGSGGSSGGGSGAGFWTEAAGEASGYRVELTPKTAWQEDGAANAPVAIEEARDGPAERREVPAPERVETTEAGTEVPPAPQPIQQPAREAEKVLKRGPDILALAALALASCLAAGRIKMGRGK